MVQSGRRKSRDRVQLWGPRTSDVIRLGDTGNRKRLYVVLKSFTGHRTANVSALLLQVDIPRSFFFDPNLYPQPTWQRRSRV